MSTTFLNGAIVYRTKLMAASDAGRFARCIGANSRFVDVEIVTSTRAKGAKDQIVTFRPASESRQADLYMDEWNKRQVRAIEEGADYVIVRDDNNPGCCWVYNPLSGETYNVSAAGCTCADYVYRCRKSGLHCKHAHAVQLQADRGIIREYAPAYTVAYVAA